MNLIRLTSIFCIPLQLLILLIFFETCSASNKVSFATFPIPILVNSDDKGVFVEMVREACRRLDIKPEINVYPPRRAVKKFLDREVVAFFPALPVHLKKGMLPTTPIHYKRAFAFTKENISLPFSVKDLKGKTVGLTKGFSYPPNLTGNPDIKIDLTNSFESSLQKLQINRIDCFVGDPDITIRTMKKLKLTLNYDLSTPLYEEPVFIAFQNSSKGAMLANDFSKTLDEMHQDGTTLRIKECLSDISCVTPTIPSVK